MIDEGLRDVERSTPGKQVCTLDELQVVADFADNCEGWEHHAVRASQAGPWAAVWLVPLASLQARVSAFIERKTRLLEP